MSDVLVILWERRRVTALQAGSHGDAIDVTGAWTGDVPESLQPNSDPAAAAEWLKREFGSRGLTAKPWVVLVPRDEVVLRHLELPQASDDELPDLVRFQASAKSSVPIESTSLDFLPLPLTSDRPTRDVLAATVPRTVLDVVQKVGATSESPLAAVSFSGIALAEWILRLERKRSLDAHGPSLGVFVEGSRVELVLVGERQLMYGHAARVMSSLVTSETEAPATADGAEQNRSAILSEVSRTLIAVQRIRPDFALKRAWLVGGDAGLAKELKERVDAPVEIVHPEREFGLKDFPESLSARPLALAALTGGVLTRQAPLGPRIDFLKPRQAPPKRDPRKQLLAIGSAAALAVVFLFTVIMQGGLGMLDRAIARLSSEQSDLDSRISAGQPALAASKAINDWQARGLAQLETMIDLEDAMPGDRERPYLSDYTFSVGATGDVLGVVQATGASRTREDVEQLNQILVDRLKYRVTPTPITTSKDPDYPVKFSLNLQRLPTKTVAAATPPAK